jgi:hypothetical protein
MAGSYYHVVTDDGNLIRSEWFPNVIENLGDAYEAIEELYGMIWFLAGQSLGDEPTGQQHRAMVSLARVNYRRGLELAREMNASPDA